MGSGARGAEGGGTGAEQEPRLSIAAALGLLEVGDVEGARAVLRELLRSCSKD